MSESIPKPRYTIWQGLSMAIALSLRAIEEIRALAREPGPPGEKGEPGTNGQNGKQGENGKDGFSVDDIKFELDGDRTIVLRFVRDGVTKEIGRARFPVALYRGIYADGQYEQGDMVTFDGGIWHCNKATTTGPGNGHPAWKLACRAGRNGKDGLPGKSAPKPSSTPFGDK
jgi:hypothetical protein